MHVSAFLCPCLTLFFQAFLCRSTLFVAEGPLLLTAAMEDHDIGQQSAAGIEQRYSLLRGAPLRVAWHQRGRTFENRVGTAESQVDHIDNFVSHTWQTPQSKKFMALS